MAKKSLGSYIVGNSFIHKIDPRVKLLINLTFIVMVFLTRELIVLATIFAVIVIAFSLSGTKAYSFFRHLLTVFFIGLFLFLINVVIIDATDTNNSYGSWWVFTLTDQAIKQTIVISFRIFIMIISTSLLTTTTKPIALTRAIEDILYPLKWIKVPVHIIAIIISIALRFIPTLLSEAQRIMKAQASRGVDFSNGNIRSKLKSSITLIIPLFVSAFAKAEDLGNAMEARGYDPYSKRTRYRHYTLSLNDLWAAIVVIALISFVILANYNIADVPYWTAWA